jgi:DNA-binding transcriptional LysR family regulator
MEIGDLRSFLTIARHANIRSASAELFQSPSALSKAIKRLEASLNTPLFDRIGKSLRLNTEGEQLLRRAEQLVSLANQTEAEFRGEAQQIHCRIVGPAILQWHSGAQLSAVLQSLHPGSGLAFSSQFEDAAIVALNRGTADFALVTQAAINNTLSQGLEAIALGSFKMKLCAGTSHPLSKHLNARSTKTRSIKLNLKEVLNYDFVSPNRSLFCGLDRGVRSDGWTDQQAQRKIRFWVEDLQLLVSLVQTGQALAYLPDFALDNANLFAIDVKNADLECVEQCWLVWRPATASGWQKRFVDRLVGA